MCASQVLERILAVDYHFPASIPVSEACKDLLRHILVADPAKRYSIQDIQKHPWCVPAAHSSSSDSALSGMPPLQSRSDWPREECVSHLLARSWEVCINLLWRSWICFVGAHVAAWLVPWCGIMEQRLP